MELADVELRAQRGFGLFAQPLDGHRAELVGQRLRRVGDVALDFGGGVGAAHARVRQHVVDRPLAAPALGVEPGVDHQPHRPQHLVVERAPVLHRIGVEPHVVAQRLGIERPAFDEGGVAVEALERRQALVLLRQADLEVVPRHAFVEVERGHAGDEAAREVVGVVEEDPRPRAVGRALVVAAARLVALAVSGVGLDQERRARHAGEEARDLRVHSVADLGITGGHRGAAGGMEAGVGADMLEEGVQRSGEAQLRLHRFHVAVDAPDFSQAEPMDRAGRQGERRLALDQPAV